MARKAQTTMMVVVLLIIIFAVLALFLFSLAKTASNEDYVNIYANNLLISLMRTDTGYPDQKCKLLSDTAACAFVDVDYPCGDSGMTCYELLEESVEKYLNEFEMIKQNYDYLLVVEPKGFCPMGPEGCRSISFGNPELEDAESRRTVYYTVQERTPGGNIYNLMVKLHLARK